MAVDPRDPEAVGEALVRWASAHHGGPVELVGPPTAVGAGFDSYIHLVTLTGAVLPEAWRAPLVVRLLPSVDRAPQAAREAAVQGWAADQGYPAPRVLAVLQPDAGLGLPAQVMERAPGTTMLDALSARPWRAFALLRQLADLQLALHALPSAGWPSSTDPQVLVDQRLGLTRRAATQLQHEGLLDALERVRPLAAVAASGPQVVCHGDFHPLNVMVDGERGSVIDWTDAGLGPPEADVARTLLLFHVASIAASSTLERVVLRRVGPRLARRYRRAYEARAPLDETRLRAWEALHGLHGWSQVVTLHAGGFEDASSSEQGRIPLEVGEYLRRRFEIAVGCHTP